MKTITIILIIITCLVVLAWAWFYWNFSKIQVKDVSNELPFSTIINKKLVLERDVYLIRNNTSEFYNSISTIVDDKNLTGAIDKETTLVKVIKKGTPLTITETQLQKKGSIGTKSIIKGTLHTKEHDILFKQSWGANNDNVIEENVKIIENANYYTFKKPIWETENEFDVNKTYFLPKF